MGRENKISQWDHSKDNNALDRVKEQTFEKAKPTPVYLLPCARQPEPVINRNETLVPFLKRKLQFAWRNEANV